MTNTPQVAVQCLASYNAGRLIFEWVDATDTDELESAQKRVAARAVEAAKEAGEYPVYFGDPEEFMVADYDNFPSDIIRHLGEYPSYEDVARFGALIEDKGYPLVDAAATVLDDVSELDEDWIDAHHRGEWDDEESYAREYVGELGWSDVPAVVYADTYDPDSKVSVFEELDSYIDWESVARELFRHGNFTYVGGHVFEDEV